MKSRITITVSPRAAARLDAIAREEGVNRSRTVEALIEDGLRSREARELDRLAARFFAGEPSEAERREDATWEKLRRGALADDD